MTYPQIQRRAFAIALVTLAAAMAIALGYWQGVRKGVLPSPVQPLHQDHAPAVSVVALARSAKPAPAPAPTAPPVLELTPLKPQLQFTKPQARPEAQSNPPTTAAAGLGPSGIDAFPTSELKTTSPKAVDRSATTAAKAPTHAEPSPTAPALEPDPLDLQRARAWLSDTNQRPVIRVHYELTDLLQLAQAGRGLILASSTDPAEPRSLYLQAANGSAPLFAPCTENIARPYSNYRLLLAPSSRLAEWKDAFSLYFPKNSDAVELTFLPDKPLATAIFAEIAKGERTTGGASTKGTSLRAEGRLLLEGGQPRFELMTVGLQR